MDDVVDLTDDEEFESQKQIKTETLRSKLVECGVSQQDAEKVKVVCVSAAPDGKKIDIWKSKLAISKNRKKIRKKPK